ncbi:MAG: hypothetical protein V1929_09455 [bacterium]
MSDESCGSLSSDDGLLLTFVLGGGHGWVQLKHVLDEMPRPDTPLTFLIKMEGEGADLEIKFVDRDRSVFGIKLPIHRDFSEWTRVTALPGDAEYWWGGDDKLGALAECHLAFSGSGSGTVRIRDIGFSASGMASSFTHDPQAVGPRGPFLSPGPLTDPDSELPGIGFRQRRADHLEPEDPLVLEWLKTLQDVSSPGRQALPTTEDNQLQTFNNSLVAMAFILKGEKERAERILDFYASRTDRANTDPLLQNFFLNGEARGFFQHVALNDTTNEVAFHTKDADRWMGDMAWLLLAYTYYGRTYEPDRYRDISNLLGDLLVAWFTDDPKVPGGGYVRHGWRKGDQYLHEEFGHPEGNIDCYAVFKLLGDEERAAKIRTWLERVIHGNNAPLDLYTWRVLAYDGDRAELLDIPDFDLRYRKTVTFNGKKATGPYHSCDAGISNVWLDGLGHIACAYQAAGNRERGWFYANQFDAFIMESQLGGKITHTLPYTANSQGGFDFDQSKGVISVAAWYIFARNGFNPMTLRQR